MRVDVRVLVLVHLVQVRPAVPKQAVSPVVARLVAVGVAQARSRNR
jgi:hypothetical protein